MAMLPTDATLGSPFCADLEGATFQYPSFPGPSLEDHLSTLVSSEFTSTLEDMVPEVSLLHDSLLAHVDNAVNHFRVTSCC